MRKYLDAYIVHETKDMSKEQWLEARKCGIGGSDAASILGLNPYKSSVSVYIEKIDYIHGVSMSDKNINVILSSPFKRAYDTVYDFALKNGLDIEVIEDFRERKIDSEWIPDFNAFCKAQWEDCSYKLSDGENLGEVQNRNIQALQQVLEKYNGKNIVIGSHGTALSTIINYYDNTFGYSEFEEIRGLMPWIVQFTFDNMSCVKIQKYNLFDKQD